MTSGRQTGKLSRGKKKVWYVSPQSAARQKPKPNHTAIATNSERSQSTRQNETSSATDYRELESSAPIVGKYDVMSVVKASQILLDGTATIFLR